MKRKAEELRSFRWFGPDTYRGFGHRSRLKQLGYRREDFTGRPVIAIINTWSEINPCHLHLRERAESVKKGVWQAGGFPVEIPAFSITEMYMKPSPMLYRNLLAMDTEEALRSLPVDGAVLMGGCDKTTPGLLMGAISVDLPAVYLPAGPMLRGNWNGQPLGSGTDGLKFWTERCAGNITEQEWGEIEDGIARSPGFCMTMGTASTMTALAEALGLTLPGASSIPAADSNHIRMAMNCGEQIVEMVWEDRKPSDILSLASFRNASAVDMAIGWSTNAIIHLVAIAGRCGLKLELPLFGEISRRVPMLADIRPSGRYLMEDFFYAGGLRALMAEIRDLLELDCPTVNGKPLGENLESARIHNAEVIRPRANPLFPSGGTTILYGSLAPDGAVIKTSAADPKLAEAYRASGGFPGLQRHGRADQSRRPRRDAGFSSGATECGAAGWAGDARMGDAADPEKTARPGRSRYGADIGCAHERHGIRDLRVACFTRELDWRSSGAGLRWRFDFARCGGWTARSAGIRC